MPPRILHPRSKVDRSIRRGASALSGWDVYATTALLAAFGAACTWTGVRLLTAPVEAVDPRFRRLARGSRFTEWLGAEPSRPRLLLRGVGVALVTAGLLILLTAARLGASVR